MQMLQSNKQSCEIPGSFEIINIIYDIVAGSFTHLRVDIGGNYIIN